jgi:hypothetical protein
LADLNETATSKIDLTISDFRASGCAWCHPGGTVSEYDREGYRFDGKPGLFNAGANPNPKAADYKIAGLVATTTDASGYCRVQGCSTGTIGAGYFEVTAVSASLNNPEDTINQGTLLSAWDPVSNSWKTVGKKYASATAAGSGEADCLMCHLSYQYANLERNYAFPGATMPKLGASLGLVGAGAGTAGLLNIAAEGTSTANPNVALTGWNWNEYWGAATSTPGNPVMLREADVQRKPRNENCALCHFPDKSMAGTAAVTGPAGKPLGFTAFQKVMPAGTMRDGDEIPGVNGKDGNNDAEWKIAKGRVEGGKRGESINDPNNRDAHMKWGSTTPAGALKLACVDCHYNLEGTFSALTDPAQNGAIIQPTVTTSRMDHQFAKGDNTPDGKNMDQLDNTVTCESCHISRTHPNAGAAPNPSTAHAGIPAVHFDKIACRTCHIPSLNSPMNQDLADFTVGPFRTFERAQLTEVPTGVNRKPLYMWRQTEHGQGDWVIQPFDIMAVAVVANATAKNTANEATAVVPTFQRLGKRAAELLRAQKGDADGNGVHDWSLNAPQGGDTSLIVNTAGEITDFLTQIGVAGGASAPANPVIHFYFNQFTLSHNVVPKAGNPANGKYILGSLAGGGCVMCHSDSSNPTSVGFFDRTVQLFAQPLDGGAGLVQTVLPAASPLSGDLERVNAKFPYSNPLASGTTLPSTFAATALSTAVNLSGTNGQTVGNSVNQGTLLGYSPEQLALLKNPGTASFTITATATSGGTVTDGAGNSLLGARSIPGFTSSTYTITPASGFRLFALIVNGVSIPVTSTGMTYTFTKVGSDQAMDARFVPMSYVLGVATVGTGQGTITTADTDPDISCSDNIGWCSGTATASTTVTLSAQPAAGSAVSGWSGCSSVSADMLTCTVTMTSDETVTVTFMPTTYLLTVTEGGGQGTVTTVDTDPDIACTENNGTCSGSASAGATVILLAQPAAGSLVSAWSGCTSVSSDKLTCITDMTIDRLVTVTFAPTTYLVTVSTAGDGQGSVATTATDPDISCSGNTGTCSGSAPNGATVTLSASPAAGSFVYAWTGCATLSSDKLTCTVTMTSNKALSVTFLRTTYLLTVKTAGKGQGTVSTTDTDPDISCSGNTGTCSGTAAALSTVTLTAAPASGSYVKYWSGCTSVSADKLTCTKAVTADKTVSATFEVSP